MNNVKDIQRTDTFHAFLSAYNVKTTPFSKNTSGERAYARAERIVAALFLLTNHFNQGEQLRSSLRQGGTKLLSSILSLRTGIRSSGASLVDAALAQIRELISLVRMSAIAGYISTQNAGEVVQALDDLGSLLVMSQHSDLSENVIITHEDLIPRTPEPEQIIVKKKEQSEVVNNIVVTADESLSDTKKTTVVLNNKTERTNGRSGEVIEILKVRGKLGVKDIYTNMPGCSEKMIQRELAQLVSKGQVRKIGEKRWSRYELVL